MPKELRAILFTAEEVRGAVEHFLQRGGGVGKVQAVQRVELEIFKGNLRGRAHIGRGAEATITILAPQDMVTAVLMYCSHLRIPLPTKALKQLEAVSNGLMLTMSLSEAGAGPRVQGNSVHYSAPLPSEMKDAVGGVRE